MSEEATAPQPGNVGLGAVSQVFRRPDGRLSGLAALNVTSVSPPSQFYEDRASS